ncbi:fimbria/pilus outer membrane usher protein [Klebsiella pneumoniae subsp. pneumoniae]|nr:fimbria/pilus outer membrane usher protein [Klebsiella pneumoniae subsp. pneumoniae]
MIFYRAAGRHAESPQSYIPESQWQQGINAGLLNYSVTGQRNAPRHNGATIDSQFVSLQPGLNLGPWRLRNYSTYSHSDNNSRWESVLLLSCPRYSHPYAASGGQNTYTSSGIFDGLSFYRSAAQFGQRDAAG